MDEFDVMREQLTSMKKQLNTQHIINQDLMRKVMRGKASWLNRLVTAELVSLPIVYLLFVGICYGYHISQWVSFSFLILGGIDALFDLRTVRIPNRLFSSASILSLKKFILRQKRERFIQTCISGTLCVVWIIWLFTSMAISTNAIKEENEIMEAAKTGGLIGGGIGAVIGLTVLIILYRRMQRTSDTLLRDLDDLQNTNE